VAEAALRGYVTNPSPNNVSVIDLGTNLIIATVPVETDPKGVAITPDGTEAYVTNNVTANVSVIDTTSHLVTATIPVGVNPCSIAITPFASLAVAAECCQNNFLTQSELFIVITWTSVDGAVQYNILRDNVLIDIVPATDPREFVDHNREPNRTYVYKVEAKDAEGNLIAEASVTITCN